MVSTNSTNLEIIKSSFTDILIHYGIHNFRQSGSSLMACCPFHEDTHPSMSVELDRGLWNCHTCGTGGGVVGFVMKKEGVDNGEATRTAIEILGLEDKSAFTKEERKEWGRRQRERDEAREAALAALTNLRIEALANSESDWLELDAQFRLLINGTTLNNKDKSDLKRRGLTEQMIRVGGFVSLFGFHPTKAKVPGRNPEGTGLTNYPGYLVPAFSPKGLILGAQIRTEDKKNKYRWMSNTSTPSKLPGLEENPLTCLVGDSTETVYLGEGFLKPYVIHSLSGLTVVGAAGGAFLSSETLLKDWLSQLGPTKVIMLSDSGSAANNAVATKDVKTLTKIESWGYEVGVCNWGQLLDKEKPDADELLATLAPSGNARDGFETASVEITLDEFKVIAFGEESDGDVKPPQSKVEEIKEFYHRRWLKSSEFNTRLTVDERYITIAPPLEGEMLAVQSPLGTGKTVALAHWSEQWKQAKIGSLHIGYLNNLLIQTSTKVKGHHIWADDGQLMMMDGNSHVLMCVNSLVNCELQDLENRVIILDETTAIIKALLMSSTLKDRRDEVIKRFSYALKNARSIICLDAMMTDWAVEFIWFLAGEQHSIRKVKNTHKVEGRKVEFLEGSEGKSRDYSDLISGIMADAVEGKKIAICSDSQEQCEALDKQLTQLGIEVFRLDSKTSGSDLAKEFLKRPEVFFRMVVKAQILIYSPSAESGLSIDGKYFDNQYGIFMGVLGASEICQMIFRIRECDNRFIYVAPRGMIGKTWQGFTPASVAKAQRFIVGADIGRLDYVTGESLYDRVDLESERIQIKTAYTIQAIQNYETANLRDCVRHLLTEGGCEVVEYLGLYDESASASNAEAKEEIRTFESAKIHESDDITSMQAHFLAKKPTASVEQQRQLAKFYITDSLPGIINNEVWHPDFVKWIRYDERRAMGEARQWWHYLNPKDSDTQNSAHWKKLSSNETLPVWLYKSEQQRATAIRDLCGWLIDAEGIEFTSDDIEGIHTKMQQKEWQYRLRVTPTKQPIASLKRILELVGLSTALSRRSGGIRYYTITREKQQHPNWIATFEGVTRKLDERTHQDEIFLNPPIIEEAETEKTASTDCEYAIADRSRMAPETTQTRANCGVGVYNMGNLAQTANDVKIESFTENQQSTEGEKMMNDAVEEPCDFSWKGHRFVITGPSPRTSWGAQDLRGVAKGEPWWNPMKKAWCVDILVDGFGVVTVAEGVCVEEKYFQDGMQRNGDKWVMPVTA